jgi:hypothetical protein
MSKLAIGISPPSEDAARLCDSHGVATATGKVNHLFCLQLALHLIWTLLPNATFSVKTPS